MLRISDWRCILLVTSMTAALLVASSAAIAGVRIEGQVQAGGGSLSNSTVTLWAGSSGEPRQLAQTKTGSDGSFQLDTQENVGPDVSLYLTAQGVTVPLSRGCRCWVTRRQQRPSSMR
jgi:hypothetical protein